MSRASRKSENPTYEDWYNVLKIFRYLKGNQNYGLKFIKENSICNIFEMGNFRNGTRPFIFINYLFFYLFILNYFIYLFIY